MARRLPDDEGPTHNLCVKETTSKRNFFVQVGAAWVNGWNQVRIQLNPGTVLRWDDELEIKLFPNVPGGRVKSGEIIIDPASFVKEKKEKKDG